MSMNLVKLNVPGYDFSVDQYKDAFLYYQKEYANKYGVTLIQDCMHSDNAREAYIQLAQEGRLTVRLRGVYVLEPAFFKNRTGTHFLLCFLQKNACGTCISQNFIL